MLHFLPLEGEKEKVLGLAKLSESAVVCWRELVFEDNWDANSYWR